MHSKASELWLNRWLFALCLVMMVVIFVGWWLNSATLDLPTSVIRWALILVFLAGAVITGRDIRRITRS